MVTKFCISVRGTQLHKIVIDCNGDVSVVINELNRLVYAYNTELHKKMHRRRRKRKIKPSDFITISHYIVADNNILFRTAAEKGFVNLALYFLENGADPTACDNYAIKMAAKNGHFNMIGFLLRQPGVNPQAELGKAMSWAKYNGHTDIIELLDTVGIIADSAYSRDGLYSKDRLEHETFEFLQERENKHKLECIKYECMNV